MMCAVNTQLYLTCSCDDSIAEIAKVEHCVEEIRWWMHDDMLLNDSKTEVTSFPHNLTRLAPNFPNLSRLGKLELSI